MSTTQCQKCGVHYNGSNCQGSFRMTGDKCPMLKVEKSAAEHGTEVHKEIEQALNQFTALFGERLAFFLPLNRPIEVAITQFISKHSAQKILPFITRVCHLVGESIKVYNHTDFKKIDGIDLLITKDGVMNPLKIFNVRHIQLQDVFEIMKSTQEVVIDGCDKCDGPGGVKTFANQVSMPINGKVQCIDYCIHHIVAALNAANIPTVASCCGHGEQDGRIDLEDGRVLVIKRSEDM